MNWKTKLFSFIAILTILLGSFGVSTVFAHHVDKVEKAYCQGNKFMYEVKGDYVGGSSLRQVIWNVNITIDGSVTNKSGSWEGTSNGFNLFTVSGEAQTSVVTSGYIKMSEWKRVNGVYKWVEVDSESFGLNKTNNCIPTEKITYGTESTCDLWKAWYKVGNGSKTYYAQGTWTNPYLTESVVVPAYPLTPPSGVKYDLAEVPSVTINEKTNCRKTHTITYNVNVSCDGWNAYYQVDGGSPVVYAQGTWTNPYTLETANIPAYTLTPPSGEVYDKTNIPATSAQETGDCQKSHTITYNVKASCDGWYAYYQIDGGSEVQYASGLWSDPFTLETANIAAYALTPPNGEIYNISEIPASTATETADCQKSHTVTYDVKSSCDGWNAYYSIDGGSPVTYASGSWSDPFTLETANIATYALTPPNGEIYNISEIPATSAQETGDCQKKHIITYNSESSCSGYVAYYQVDGGSPVTYASGLWSDPFTLESVNIPAFSLTPPSGELYDLTEIPGTSAQEEENCQNSHTVSYGVSVSCDGWYAYYKIDNGSETQYASGLWSDPFTLESVNIPAFSLTPPSGELYDLTEIPGTSAQEEENCLQERPSSGEPTIETKCSLDANGLPIVSLYINVGNTIIDAGTYGIITEDTVIPNVPEGNYTWTWKAKEGYEGEGVITVIVKADCKQPGHSIWRAVCKNNCGGERWETTSGVTTWKSKDLFGSGPEGILVIGGVNDDCVITAKGCVIRTIKYVVDKVETGGFTVYDRGREFRPIVITDAWGQQWNLFVGYTDTCFENENTSYQECGKILPDIELPGNWGTMHNMADDGWSVAPDNESTFVHPAEFPCNLAPADWMTATVDGQKVAYKLPGVSGNDWRIYLFKKGILPWPAGWPDAPVKGAWDKHAYPLQDANAWQADLMNSKKHQWEWYLAFPTAK